MAENLARAKANFDVLESQLNDACLLVQSLEKNVGFKDGQCSTMPSVPLAAVMVGTVLNSYLVIFIFYLFTSPIPALPRFFSTCFLGVYSRFLFLSSFSFQILFNIPMLSNREPTFLSILAIQIGSRNGFEHAIFVTTLFNVISSTRRCSDYAAETGAGKESSIGRGLLLLIFHSSSNNSFQTGTECFGTRTPRTRTNCCDTSIRTRKRKKFS